MILTRRDMKGKFSKNVKKENILRDSMQSFPEIVVNAVTSEYVLCDE